MAQYWSLQAFQALGPRLSLLRRAQTPLLRAAQVGSGKVVKVTGIQGQGRTATILLRGSNKLVLEEAERSLHDALCVIRCLVQKRALIPGGAAPEMEVEHQLIQWAKTLQVPQPRQPVVMSRLGDPYCSAKDARSPLSVMVL